MSTPSENQKETIISLLATKSVMKQDVYSNTIAIFNQLKEILKEKADFFADEAAKIDSRVNLFYKDISLQSMQLKVAGDILDFQMHSNVFGFDKSNAMYKTAYVRDNPLNAFCGIINVYNFLADSYKYNRLNDVGSLIARIFINRENHFFVETKTQIGYKYHNFSIQPISKENLTDIVMELIIYSITFDLYTPPYDSVGQVTVYEMQEKSSSAALRTGKRLGYGGHHNDQGRTFDDEAHL
ncbi:hypothetical protein [Aurantibacillus circumpalustris]|uniref:hypothetical protein n=1 Tax=Aurantibacillus circumpalustris TaxID=3036359 RepID=UPI00295A5DDB|nr:hypothetical protein [Aurantibacillus circumpalustris]